jgi:hypothetical protein
MIDIPILLLRAVVTTTLVLVVVVSSLAYGQAPSRVALNRVVTKSINKPSGRIDQVVALPDGGFVIRDFGYSNESAQAIEIYDREGRFRKKIGTFGKLSGQYYRLKAIAVATDGTIWAADIMGRVTRFGQDGRVISTKLIQTPGYQIFGLALDEARGIFYLSGCLPKKTYLDLGCHLIHKYSLKNGEYQRSFLDTDPEALEKHLLALEDYHLDIDGRGEVWAADGPIRKVFHVDPANGQTQSFSLTSRIMTPFAAINPKQGLDPGVYENAFLIDRVLVVGDFIVVSIGQLKTAKYVLQVFDASGRQIAVDLNSPGRLVGKTQNNRLYFAASAPQGLQITEYEVSVSGRRK